MIHVVADVNIMVGSIFENVYLYDRMIDIANISILGYSMTALYIMTQIHKHRIGSSENR